MNSAYRKMIEQQCLSEQAKSAFYEKLGNMEPRRKKNVLRKVVVIAACVCLLIPTVVLAAENIFGISLIGLIERNVSLGNAGEGYDINFTNVYGRPISEFSPEIQTLDGYKTVAYNSWEDAEAELGIDLITNSILSNSETYPEKSFQLEVDPEPHTLGSQLHHCYATYAGKDGQFYRANVTAAYRRDGMHITVRTTVTAEHPAISQEREAEMHWVGITYPQTDVEQISQEQYTAKNGLIATVVVIDRAGTKSTDYEASFVANGVSYRITVDCYTSKRNAEAKELLLDILEGFSF